MCTAFAAGARGQIVRSNQGLLPGDHDIALWGVLRGCWEIIKGCKRLGRPFWYLDHAYYRRGHMHRVYRVVRSDLWMPKGGLPLGRGMKRWRQFEPYVDVRPWRPNGKTVLVCPSSPIITRLLKSEQWLADALALCERYTDRRVVIRKKTEQLPLAKQIELEDVHCVVADRSMVAVEAVLLGCPVFVHPGSPAAPMGLTDLSQINEPVRPERLPWMTALAMCQYSEAEMRSGEAWRRLTEIWPSCEVAA